MTDFEIMGQMSEQNKDIKSYNHVLKIESSKKVSKITIQIESDIAQDLMRAAAAIAPLKHYLALYILSKDQFDAIKAQQNVTKIIKQKKLQ